MNEVICRFERVQKGEPFSILYPFDIDDAIAALRAQTENNPPLTLDGACSFCPICDSGCMSNGDRMSCPMLPIVAMAQAYTTAQISKSVDNPPLTEERFEGICEAVHNGWWDEKIRQGVTDHPDMKPYAELSEEVKEYDRVTVRRVLDAMGVAYRSKPERGEE